jgi:hypothetical protein
MACVDLLAGIAASCDALNKVGGVNKRVWIGQLSQITGYSQDANGNIETITMDTDASSNPYTLKKFTGKKNKNNGTYELTSGDNVNTFNTSFNLEVFHYTQEDRENLEALINADDVFVVAQTDAGQIEVFGIDEGLNASAGTGGTGTNLQDKTSFTLTLSGEQRKLPYLFLNGGTLATSITYLDGISE